MEEFNFGFLEKIGIKDKGFIPSTYRLAVVGRSVGVLVPNSRIIHCRNTILTPFYVSTWSPCTWFFNW